MEKEGVGGRKKIGGSEDKYFMCWRSFTTNLVWVLEVLVLPHDQGNVSYVVVVLTLNLDVYSYVLCFE